MGRTLRKRKRKLNGNRPISLSSDVNFIRLTKWMTSNGWKQCSALHLSVFPATGRGLMAGHNLSKGDLLISIPRSVLITTATVIDSIAGHIILNSKSSETDSFLCQELLASFLMWERHLKKKSIWSEYISTLPASFTLPLYLDNCCIDKLPYFLLDQANFSLRLAESCYHHMMMYFENSICSHCHLLGKDIFTRSDFIWGWCCVNTRAVFIEPQYVPEHALSIKDKNCLALAPYLDMFNHSDTVTIKVRVNENNNCYEITTNQPFKKFDEVFINYGPHSNSKLFLEYGFILPSNVHDVIPVNVNHLIRAFESAGFKIVDQNRKICFCQKHQLDKQLYISDNGLSWNCSTLIKILLSGSSDIKRWESICFMGENLPFTCESMFNCIKMQLIADIEAIFTSAPNRLFVKCNKNCTSSKSTSLSTLKICEVLLQQSLFLLNTVKNL